jgi:hypothetical protein
MGGEVGSSRILESQNSGKAKVPAFKLALGIEQRTNLWKAFEERILNSQVEFSLWELLGIARRSSTTSS